jgi:predicted nucleic acid-binding protein
VTAARRVFLDSSVLVYAHSATEPARRERARALADLPGAVVSSQVLGEIASVLFRKFSLGDPDVRDRIIELARRCEVIPVTASIVLDAFRVKERYRLSYFDSQIVAAALVARASTLYSEDLHHGLLVDEVLRIVNPFRGGVEQPASRYRVRRRNRAT